MKTKAVMEINSDLENDQHCSFVIFIVAQCILKSTQFTHQQMHYLLTWLKVLNLR